MYRGYESSTFRKYWSVLEWEGRILFSTRSLDVGESL